MTAVQRFAADLVCWLQKRQQHVSPGHVALSELQMVIDHVEAEVQKAPLRPVPAGQMWQAIVRSHPAGVPTPALLVAGATTSGWGTILLQRWKARGLVERSTVGPRVAVWTATAAGLAAELDGTGAPVPSARAGA